MIQSRHHAMSSHLGTFLRTLLLSWAVMLALVAVVAFTVYIPGSWMLFAVALGPVIAALARRGGVAPDAWEESGELPSYPVVKVEVIERSPLWDRDLDGGTGMGEPRFVS